MSTLNSLFDIELDFLLQFDGIGTNDLLNFLSILENQECGHSANAVFLSEFREFVDVDFEVVCVGVLFAEFDDFGCDDLRFISTVQERTSLQLVCNARSSSRRDCGTRQKQATRSSNRE